MHAVILNQVSGTLLHRCSREFPFCLPIHSYHIVRQRECEREKDSFKARLSAVSSVLGCYFDFLFSFRHLFANFLFVIFVEIHSQSPCVRIESLCPTHYESTHRRLRHVPYVVTHKLKFTNESQVA